MTKDEALKLALEALESCYSTGDDYKYQFYDDDLTIPAITAIKKALANEALEKMAENARELGLDYEPEQEPVKITHKHEWFRTGEMKIGQMRCISCGTWGQEEMPQQTWIGLTDEERNEITNTVMIDIWQVARAIEAKLKEKNT